MLDYIITFFALFSIYRIIIIFKNKRKPNVPIIKGAEPFFYKKSRKKGILLIHGFTSTAYDLRPLGKYLADKGISVYGMLIKGHGTCPENLAATNSKNWIKSVDKAYQELKQYVDKVYIGGDSFGGNLSLLTASKYPVAGVISMGTPIYFKKERRFKVILPLLRFFKSFQKKWYHYNLDKKIVRKRITYDKIPLNCIKHVVKTISLSRKRLPKITAPILIMQSTTDFGVSPKSVDYIYKHTNSTKKIIKWVPNSYHVFIIDNNKEQSFKEIYSFIKNN